ncbi:MAG TPA: cation diffusion facilitator family transporter [Hyphomicrobiaceae bacterium]|nr:cation diffusion facilitator family transporter [Hyphomicrobiaceae bacterium]
MSATSTGTGMKIDPPVHDPANAHAGHGHGGHAHGHAHSVNETRVGWAAALTAAYMLAEAAGGLFAGSLALLADAGHMLADAASLTLAWAAFRIARRPSDWQRTYGFHRFQVIAAYTNGITLIFIAAAVVWEALHRLREPVAVLGGPMLAVAIVGLIVNIVAYLALHGADRTNLNIRGAMLHVLGDMAGSAAAIVAALVILWTGWSPIDPLLSLLVALLILSSAWGVVAASGRILIEAAPRGLDVRALAADLEASVPGVENVHHVHAWSLTEARPMVTLHARIGDDTQAYRIVAAIKQRLKLRYGVVHATIEIECEHCADQVPAAKS